MTITILKHSDTYVFADYLNGRAIRRCRELSDDKPVQLISRHKEDGAPVLVLMKPSEWDAYLAAYSALSAAVWSYRMVDRSDDFLGRNMTTIAWLLNHAPEVPAEMRKAIEEGTSNSAFEVCKILNTKQYYVQDFKGDPLGASKGGDAVGYVVSYKMYQGMQETPVATTFSGTGNGKIAPELCPGLSVTEDITLTCTAAAANGGVFSVVGSVSGNLGNATVGIPFVSSKFKCLISDGTVDFAVGAAFVVKSRAALL